MYARQFEMRRRPGLMLAALIAMLVVLAGCPRRTPEVVVSPAYVPQASTVEIQAQFDAAVAEYELGRFAVAADAFRLFSAEHPRDALALRAELYLGRSLAAGGDTLAAIDVFRSLSGAAEDRDTAELASVYWAFVHGVRGEFADSRAQLATLLRESPEYGLPASLVIPGDEALLGSLVAEAQIAADRPLYALLSLEGVALNAPDDTLLFYAYDRAVEVAETRMSPPALEAAFNSGSVFVQAVVAAPLVAAQVTAGDVVSAQATLDRATDAMITLQLLDRLAAAQSLLDAGSSAPQATFGVVLSLTGPNRRAGRAALGGILLAQRAFGDAPPSVIAHIRDTANDGDSTEVAVRELAALGVSAIIGPIEEELSFVARRECEQAGIPFIAMTTQAFDERRPGSWRVQIDPGAEGALLVSEARSRGAVRYVVVRADDLLVSAYTERVADAAARAISDTGGELVRELLLITTPSELQASAEQLAQQIAQLRPQAVILALEAAPAAAMGAWLASQNVWAAARADAPSDGRLRVVLAASSFAANDELLRNSARYFEEAIIAGWFVPGFGSHAAIDFGTRFEATYGRAAGVLDASAFDAASIVRRMLLDEGRTTRARMTEGINALAGYDAVIGRLGFDGFGNPTSVPGLYTVRGGVFAPVTP